MINNQLIFKMVSRYRDSLTNNQEDNIFSLNLEKNMNPSLCRKSSQISSHFNLEIQKLLIQKPMPLNIGNYFIKSDYSRINFINKLLIMFLTLYFSNLINKKSNYTYVISENLSIGLF